MEDQIASLARDLLGALESQQLELRRVVDVHQDTLDALYGESVLSSWTHSLSPSRRVSAKATNQLQDGDEWQSSVEQDPGLSVMSEMSAEMANAPTVQPVEEPAQAASDSQPSMRPHKSMRASGMAPAASITEMMASSSNTKDMVMLDTAASIIVVLNTLELAFELECEGHSIGTHVGIPDGMQCDDVGPLFVVLNHIFQLAYTVELIFRLWYHRWFFFSSCTNLFDILLVLIGAVDVYVLAVIAERSSSSELMQLLRILKLGRVVRLGRTFHLFPGLRLLMHACTSFLPALGWSMVLLGLCITMGGLTMGTLRKARERRAPVTAAAMVMRDYEMRLRSLEVQCRELSSQNARLSSELTAGEVKQQQGRELNLRLSREVQELRRLNAEANDKVMALEEERATQRDLPVAQTDDVQPVQPLTASHLLEVVEFVEPPPGLAGLEPVAMSQSYAPIEEPELFWGCEQTQIYSASLLLAHRDLALRADLGPPGLEHPAMDGLRAEEVPDVISRKIWRPRKLQAQRLHRKRQNKRQPKAAAA